MKWVGYCRCEIYDLLLDTSCRYLLVTCTLLYVDQSFSIHIVSGAIDWSAELWGLLSWAAQALNLTSCLEAVCVLDVDICGRYCCCCWYKTLNSLRRDIPKEAPSLYLWRSSLCMTIHNCDQIWWLWRNFKQLWGMNKHKLSSVHKINQIWRWGSWMLLEVFDVWARGWMQLEIQLGIQFLLTVWFERPPISLWILYHGKTKIILSFIECL
jgi:hypothetical protein